MCEPYSVRRRVPGTPPASDIARSVLYVGTGHMLIPTELTASAGLVDFESLQVVLAVRCNWRLGQKRRYSPPPVTPYALTGNRFCFLLKLLQPFRKSPHRQAFH